MQRRSTMKPPEDCRRDGIEMAVSRAISAHSMLDRLATCRLSFMSQSGGSRTIRARAIASRRQRAGIIVGLLSLLVSPSAAQLCIGDCNGDRRVSVDEIIHGVDIALGDLPLADCRIFDSDGNGVITVDELLMAVGFALHG